MLTQTQRIRKCNKQRKRIHIKHISSSQPLLLFFYFLFCFLSTSSFCRVLFLWEKLFVSHLDEYFIILHVYRIPFIKCQFRRSAALVPWNPFIVWDCAIELSKNNWFIVVLFGNRKKLVKTDLLTKACRHECFDNIFFYGYFKTLSSSPKTEEFSIWFVLSKMSIISIRTFEWNCRKCYDICGLSRQAENVSFFLCIYLNSSDPDLS